MGPEVVQITEKFGYRLTLYIQTTPVNVLLCSLWMLVSVNKSREIEALSFSHSDNVPIA